MKIKLITRIFATERPAALKSISFTLSLMPFEMGIINKTLMGRKLRSREGSWISKWQRLDLNQVSLTDTFITLSLTRKPSRHNWLPRRNFLCFLLASMYRFSYLFTGTNTVTMFCTNRTTLIYQIHSAHLILLNFIFKIALRMFLEFAEHAYR